jgi:RNA polymerase sigma-70 factor (ECF subfamily)
MIVRGGGPDRRLRHGEMEAQNRQADLEDVRRVLAGDADAFEGIVRRWQGPLVTMAYRFCRDRGQAEEWAQEAFLRAFRFLDRWREEAAFSTWLYSVAANVYRSQARRTRPPEVPLAEDIPVAGFSNPAHDAESGQRDEIIRRAVCSLPAKYRDALILFYFLESDVAEAARVLGLPEGTVKAHLHRGRGLLKGRLEKALGPSGGRETTWS